MRIIGHNHKQLKVFSRFIAAIVLMLVAVAILHLAKTSGSDLPNNSCTDCHRRLIYTPERHQQYVEMRKMHLESGISCSTLCHEDLLYKSSANTYGMLISSTHALFNETCGKCHDGNPKAAKKEEAHPGLSNLSVISNKTQKICGKCHEQELEEFMDSQHYKKQSEVEKAPTCLTCHERHSVRPLTPSEKEEICISCHANFNETCRKCHDGGITVLKEAHLSIVNISIVRQDSLVICGKCHEQELKEFKTSRMFEELELGEKPAPTCSTCHHAHTLRISSKIEDFCANCHNNITDIDPHAPGKTKEIMSSVNELWAGFSKARDAVISAKANGKDVTGAEKHLESAGAILKNISSLHRFNLTIFEGFETEVEKSSAHVRKNEKESKKSSTIAKAPFFEVLLLVSCVIASYFLKTRQTN